jgi:hypothetical protein
LEFIPVPVPVEVELLVSMVEEGNVVRGSGFSDNAVAMERRKRKATPKIWQSMALLEENRTMFLVAVFPSLSLSLRFSDRN